MRIKILTPGQSGKFEFTKEELEKLLSEEYNAGYADGYASGSRLNSITYTPSHLELNRPEKPWHQDITCCGKIETDISSISSKTQTTIF